MTELSMLFNCMLVHLYLELLEQRCEKVDVYFHHRSRTKVVKIHVLLFVDCALVTFRSKDDTFVDGILVKVFLLCELSLSMAPLLKNCALL